MFSDTEYWGGRGGGQIRVVNIVMMLGNIGLLEKKMVLFRV